VEVDGIEPPPPPGTQPRARKESKRMCQACVAEGRMTQAELDEANRNEGDPRADGAMIKQVFQGNADEAEDFIRDLFGSLKEDQPNPEDEAAQLMDDVARNLLTFLKSHTDGITAMAPARAAETLDSAMGRHALAEALAGQFMFKLDQRSLAFALGVIIQRYAGLLDQWADLYVRAVQDPDADPAINLDSATTPESKTAVTEAAAVQGVEPPTGMYL
jgi:hypothetical protein